jgi:hypothetical protein
MGLLDGRIRLKGKVPVAVLVGLHPLAALVDDVIRGRPADWVLCPRPGVSQHDALALFIEKDPDQISFPGIPVRPPMVPAHEGL